MATNAGPTVVEQATKPDSPHASSSSDSLDSSRPNSRTNHEASWHSYLGYLIPRGNWSPNTLGFLTLVLTLIGMVAFESRTYKLTKEQTELAKAQTCGQFLTLPGDLVSVDTGRKCRDLIMNNTLRRHKYMKRAWNSIVDAGSWLNMADSTKEITPPVGGFGRETLNLRIFNFSSVAIGLASTVIVAGLSLIIFRRYLRTEEVFTSPAKSDWQFTRHHEEGPETVSWEGYRMIRRNPEDVHPLGQLRQHIRSSQPDAVHNPTGEPKWQSRNTSEDTLVGPWKDTKWGASKVSLTSDESNEKHENLIELETEEPNKTFFDPETGEFIHLTPWKSTGVEEVHGLRPDGKGSIKCAFATMTLGATGWAGGKSIDDQLAEELQANSTGVDREEHNAGDSTTGNTLNPRRSGKPIIA